MFLIQQDHLDDGLSASIERDEGNGINEKEVSMSGPSATEEGTLNLNRLVEKNETSFDSNPKTGGLNVSIFD